MNKLRSLLLASASFCCIVAIGQTTIAERQCWLDGDIAQRQPLADAVAQIDVSGLDVGLHSLTVRACDDRGVWSSPLTKYFIVTPEANDATAIAAREYWLDGDIAQRQPLADAVAQIDVSGLDVGLHSLTVRACDDRGVWSSPLTKYFIVTPEENAATQITQREYWIDDIANRQPLNAAVAEIDISGLTVGLHSLTIHVQDDNDVWSMPITQYFVVPREDEDAEATLTHYVYWFNDDNADAKSGMLEVESGIIPVSIKHLDEGRHQISWAVGDSRGKWSAVARDSFDVEHIVMTDAMIQLATNSFEYEAEDIEPEPVVMDGDETLVRDEDYEVEYANNRNAGTATVTVRGKGFYKEAVESEFTITKAVLTVTADDQEREQGQENPELTLTYEGWKGADDESVLLTVPLATTEATVDSPVGIYEILIDGGEALNYTFTYVPGVLTVTKPVGIGEIADDVTDSVWYTLNGLRLNHRPTRPGIYFCNGRRVVIK